MFHRLLSSQGVWPVIYLRGTENEKVRGFAFKLFCRDHEPVSPRHDRYVVWKRETEI